MIQEATARRLGSRTIIAMAVTAVILGMTVTGLSHMWFLRSRAPDQVLPISTLYFNKLLGLPPCEHPDFWVSTDLYNHNPKYRRFCDAVTEKAVAYIRSGRSYCVWTAAPTQQARGFPFISLAERYRIWIEETTGEPENVINASFFELGEDGSSAVLVNGFLGNTLVYSCVSLFLECGMLLLWRKAFKKRGWRGAESPVTGVEDETGE